MDTPRMVRIEWARLPGQRPRKAGCNARLGEHGQEVRASLARITMEDGSRGFGWSRISREQAQALVGLPLPGDLRQDESLAQHYQALEYAIWDALGARAGLPVYALIGGLVEPGKPFRVPCYDTSLYMDDLHLEDNAEAAALIAAEAMEGLARGHRAFKLKVGRGAMHMPTDEGTERDIAVIRAVRAAVGPQAQIMIDANNGFNVNLAKRVLRETAPARLYWLEEAFHEDARLYAHLKQWLAAEGLDTLIADGEGEASRNLLDWARQGLVDVIQYDVLAPGFTFWLALGPQLDQWGIKSAPHHYGEPYGNYVAGHLAAAIRGFQSVEWDEATVPGLDASAYTISEGYVHIPPSPGFGLALDEDVYARAVREDGFVVQAG